MDMALFFMDMALFFMDMALFFMDMGLFFMDMGLFFMDMGLFRPDKGVYVMEKRVYVMDKGVFLMDKRGFLIDKRGSSWTRPCSSQKSVDRRRQALVFCGQGACSSCTRACSSPVTLRAASEGATPRLDGAIAQSKIVVVERCCGRFVSQSLGSCL